MDITHLLNLLLAFTRDYTLLAVIIGLGLAWYAWLRPREFFKFCILLVVLAAALHFLSLFGDTLSSGSGAKDRMIHKTTDALED